MQFTLHDNFRRQNPSSRKPRLPDCGLIAARLEEPQVRIRIASSSGQGKEVTHKLLELQVVIVRYRQALTSKAARHIVEPPGWHLRYS